MGRCPVAVVIDSTHAVAAMHAGWREGGEAFDARVAERQRDDDKEVAIWSCASLHGTGRRAS